jgi:hypothetical protein
MCASDYPHYESGFPDPVDKIMEWSSIGPTIRQKLFWDNANRCFKQTWARESERGGNAQRIPPDSGSQAAECAALFRPALLRCRCPL